jgi:hypothetical protein
VKVAVCGELSIADLADFVQPIHDSGGNISTAPTLFGLCLKIRLIKPSTQQERLQQN